MVTSMGRLGRRGRSAAHNLVLGIADVQSLAVRHQLVRMSAASRGSHARRLGDPPEMSGRFKARRRATRWRSDCHALDMLDRLH